jgi:hypothetical protein
MPQVPNFHNAYLALQIMVGRRIKVEEQVSTVLMILGGPLEIFLVSKNEDSLFFYDCDTKMDLLDI